MWVNPSSINDTSVSATDTANTLADIYCVALREPGTTNTPSAAGSQMVDNIAVSTSFNDVVTVTPVPPTIVAVRSGNAVQLSWPTANNSAYVLQTASTVNSATWGAVGGVTTSGANYTVTVPFTPTPAYFRLKK